MLFPDPTVSEPGVIGVPSEAVHAAIVPKDCANVTPEELIAHCHKHVG